MNWDLGGDLKDEKDSHRQYCAQKACCCLRYDDAGIERTSATQRKHHFYSGAGYQIDFIICGNTLLATVGFLHAICLP